MVERLFGPASPAPPSRRAVARRRRADGPDPWLDDAAGLPPGRPARRGRAARDGRHRRRRRRRSVDGRAARKRPVGGGACPRDERHHPRSRPRTDAGPGHDRIGATGRAGRATMRDCSWPGRSRARRAAAAAGRRRRRDRWPRRPAARPVAPDRRHRAPSGGDAAVGSAGDPVDACAAERRVAAERCGLAVGARVRRDRGGRPPARGPAHLRRPHHRGRRRGRDRRRAGRPPREGGRAVAGSARPTTARKSTDEAEAAARDWLVDINEVNTAARTAAVTAKREKTAATTIGARLERLTLEADAARIAAESRRGRLPRRPPGARRVRRASRSPAPPSRDRPHRGANARPDRSTRTSRWPPRCRRASRRRSSASCAATARR